MKCPKCSKELGDGAKFCDGCGAQIFETMFCPNCGEQTSTEFPFCQSCGASVSEAASEERPTIPAKKPFPKKAILFAGIGMVIVAVLILAIFLFPGGRNSDNNYAIYLKDSEIFFSDLRKNHEARQLTARLLDTDDLDNEDIADMGYQFNLFTCISEDGKYIFFPDKADYGDGCNLYYRESANPDADAIKIDSDVRSYTVNASATLVTYLKGDERNLYQYKVNEDSKDKIASEVSSFEISDDGDKIYYVNSENSIYLKYANKEKEKVTSDISSLEYVTDDFSTVYYMKDGSLYRQTEGEDKEKIASDIYDVIKIYDSGEIYYFTSEEEQTSLMDCVEDDMKNMDESITEPTYPDYPEAPDYPVWWVYDTYAEYEEACYAYEQAYDEYVAEYERLEEEYETAYDAYYEKLYRDVLRETLEEETLGRSYYSLFFYDGAETTMVTDSFAGYYSSYACAADALVISYEAYTRSDFKKINFSEIAILYDTIYDMEEAIEDSLFSSSERYIAVKGAATVVEQEKKASNIRINASGTVVYYIDDIPDEKNYGELYRIAITNGIVGKAEVYDSDVYTGYCSFINDTDFKYLKDCKDGEGELYINGKKIDSDVEAYYVEAYSDLEEIFYFTDWNDEKHCGTLKVYDGKESVKIADDVYSFSVVPDGRVLYLCDYSNKYYRGELHEWANGETRKIDDDVVYVFSSLNNKYRSYMVYSYGW